MALHHAIPRVERGRTLASSQQAEVDFAKFNAAFDGA